MWEWRYCFTILDFNSAIRLHFDPGEKDPDIH
jgi:hypothetical protein